MKKQEVIEKAWIEAVGFVPEHNDNGFQNDIVIDTFDGEKFDFIVVGHGIYRIRPKSLQGIEHNNHWIKIESESDFDKIENGNYHWYNIDNGDWEDGDISQYGKYTHYQPIKHPQQPLY